MYICIYIYRERERQSIIYDTLSLYDIPILDRGKVVAIVHFRGTTHRTTQNLRET